MQDFAPNPASIARAARPAAQPGTMQNGAVLNARRTAMGATQPLKQPKLSKDEQTAAGFQKVNGAVNAIWGAQMLLIPAFVGRKLGIKKLSGHPRALGHALMDTPMHTTLADTFTAPGKAFNTMADHYSLTGHSDKRVSGLRAQGEKIDGLMQGVKARTADPLAQTLNRGLDKVAGGKRGGMLSGLFGKFTNYRYNASMKMAHGFHGELVKASAERSPFGKISVKGIETMDAKQLATYCEGMEKALAKIGETASHSEAVRQDALQLKNGLAALKGASNIEEAGKAYAKQFNRTMHAHSPFGHLVHEGFEELSAAQRATHLEGVQQKLRGMFNHTGSEYGLRTATLDLLNNAGKGVRAAGAAVEHHAAKGADLAGLMRNAGKVLGRTSMLRGLMAVGATAAVSAAWFTMRHANNLGAQALRDLTADAGGSGNALVQRAAASFAQDKRGRLLQTGLTAGTEAVMAGTIDATMGAGMFSGGNMVFMGAMAMPMLGQVLVKDNPLLNSYANLQQAEKGELQLSEADKAGMVRQLVGAGIDAIPKPGQKQAAGMGYYNKLAAPIAAKIVEQKLTLRQTVQLVSNPEKLADIGREVQEAQRVKDQAGEERAADHREAMQNIAEDHLEMEKEARAKKLQQQLPARDADEANVANDNANVANDNAIQAAKPSLKIQADEAALEGRVEEMQRAVGQQ